MRKILTLVLALTLVFALAAPALAITGDIPSVTQPTGVAPVNIDVALFTAPANYQYNAVLSYSTIAANKLYVVNEMAFWGVALSFEKLGENQQYNLVEENYKGAKLTVSSDAFVPEFKAAYWRENGGAWLTAGQTLTSVNKALTYTVTDDLWHRDLDLFFFGQGIVAGKGILKAELVKTNLMGEGNPGLNIYSGTALLYNVRKFDNAFIVVDKNSVYTKFTVNSEEKVTYIGVSLDGGATFNEVRYYVPISGGGSVIEGIGSLTGDDFTKAKAAYEAVMAFFGFNYNAPGRLQAKHFERKAAALNLRDEVAVNLYTGSIVIPDPNVIPPKTGDAASIMGFVMIALAVAAMGFVVSRKVRA